MPKLGFSMEQGTVVQWMKNAGERVERGDIVVLVHSEKVEFEVEAQGSGKLLRILADSGTDCPPGHLLGIIADDGDDVDTFLKGYRPEETLEIDSEEQQPRLRHTGGEQVRAEVAEVRASPRARKLAAEHQIDLTSVAAAAPGKRITEADVLAFVDSTELHGRAPLVMQRIPLTGTRGEIAKRMVASSQSAAMVAISMYVNFSAAQQLREVNPGVSPLDLLIRATALELRANPRLNSAIHNDAIEVYQQVNIGFAVSLPDSLIVPVIRNADSKSLIEISNERKVLADSARNGSLSVNAVRGGTFTITSLGKYGVTVFTPILNPPQTGILGIGAVERVPVVDGDGGVKVQPRLTLTLVFDHRASDGAPAAELLKAIRERVERGEVN